MTDNEEKVYKEMVQIRNRLVELKYEGVSEDGHYEADELLIKIAINTEFTKEQREELVSIYKDIEKWYA